MKRRKTSIKAKGAFDVYVDDIVKISKEENEYFFEIGKDLTSDIAEAVSIMMRTIDWNNPVWDLEINDIDYSNVMPDKSLFWLSGGYEEWRILENYNKPWCECYLEFQEEYGVLIMNIIKRSKTLKEIRVNFLKHLSLPILYDFAISRNMVR